MRKNSLLLLTTTFPRWEKDPHGAFAGGFTNALSKRGISVSVLAPHYPGAKPCEEISGAQVERFRYFLPSSLELLCGDEGITPKVSSRPWLALLFPFLLASEFLHLALALARNRPDTVCAFWMVPNALIACLLKPFFRFRLVSYHIDENYPLLPRFIFDSLKAFTANRSDLVIAVSPLMEKELVKADPKLSKKIRVIPFGTDLPRLEQKKRGGKILLFVGRLIRWKGARYLIEGMPEILATEPDAKAVIVGGGPMEEELRASARDKGVAGRVEFRGFVPHKEMLEIMRGSTVFVHPATEEEGSETLGVALIEAMAAGLPVVGAKSGAVPYVLKNGEAGILVEPRNSAELAKAVIRLLKDENLQESLSAKSRKRAEDFSWGRISEDFEKALLPSF